MYEIAYESKQSGLHKIIETCYDSFNPYLDEEGFLLDVDDAIWIEEI